MRLLKNIIIFIISVLFYSCEIFEKKVDFNSQVKPIINKNCIACHGGVKKQGGYSMLFKEEAFSKGKSGKFGIIPGNASDSEFIKRIKSHDPEVRMPYEKDPLSDEEINILTKWIDQGAEWKEHWAYVPIKKIEPPKVNTDWIKNDIDRFIFKKASEMGLNPSMQANKQDLFRRVSLDIIGLPANEELRNKYLNQKITFEGLVDTLLSSPFYGEKWTSMWLDLARYADTKGYERDGNRNIWRYRDWLIKAFNADMPYNKFLTYQLAGDLMNTADEESLIATAFHRNTMTNDEGGTDNEEFRTAAVIDRVNTTWETLMGTTFSCVQCHSHPYDPFRFEEYYKFMAFFNNTRDEDTYDEYPVLRHYNESQKNQIKELENWLAKTVNNDEKEEIIKFIKTLQPSHNSLKCDSFINAELADTKWLAMRNNSSARLSNVNLNNKSKLIFRYRLFETGTFEIKIGNPNGPLISRKTFSKNDIKPAWVLLEIPLSQAKGVQDIFLTFRSPNLKDPNKNGIMFDWLYFSKGFPNGSPKHTNIFWDLINAKVEQTPIMIENREDFFRQTNIFERGSWLSKGKQVEPDVPLSLGKLPANTPKNRLGLAHWMTSPQNPLVARTLVNRVWEQLFGTGLVETLEDLGSQSAPSVHRELLDYLSYQFMNEYKWSIKRLIKEILVSAAYRQDSKVDPEKLKKDPNNKYFTYSPRVRLSAEQIRDQALVVSGVLNPQMYGPPVMPYQPDGIWSSPYSGDKWIKANDNQQYRRAVYTFWKRTSPYPSMITFDGVGREVCVSRRIRTNTPLQALVTLNDSVYIDLSNKLAQLSIKKAQYDYLKAIQIAYSQATGKEISKAKYDILINLYKANIKYYSKNKNLNYLFTGEKNPEMSALTIVCNTILNLDEVITKS